MTPDELNAANIHNLTCLWARMGRTESISGSTLPVRISSSWPNRCWFDWEATAAEKGALGEVLGQIPVRCAIPVWPGPSADVLEELLLAAGYEFTSQQDAMVVDLSTLKPDDDGGVALCLVSDDGGLQTWAEVCSQAFGYEIDVAVVRRIAPDPEVQLLLASVDEKPAATALLYRTGDVIGIHQVGVPKEFRGQGVARRLMSDVMNRCIASPSRYATLQASAAARGIYERLGFHYQFTIKNARTKA